MIFLRMDSNWLHSERSHQEFVGTTNCFNVVMIRMWFISSGVHRLPCLFVDILVRKFGSIDEELIAEPNFGYGYIILRQRNDSCMFLYVSPSQAAKVFHLIKHLKILTVSHWEKQATYR